MSLSMTLSDLERQDITGTRMLVPFDSVLSILGESFLCPHRLTSDDQI